MNRFFENPALKTKITSSQVKLQEMLIDVPEEVDMEVARRKLAFLGKEIDVLTPEQEKYLNESGM